METPKSDFNFGNIPQLILSIFNFIKQLFSKSKPHEVLDSPPPPPPPPTINKPIDLNSFRHIMDPDADLAVKSLYESVRFQTDRNELKEMAMNDSFAPKNLPPDLRKFVEKELSKPFSAEDIRQFEITHEVWKENGIQFVFVLFFRALPYTYMAEKPANVLRLTKLLVDQPMRRVFETAQFVFDVMDHKWWDPDQRGILTALKVRIMHAAMRFQLLHKPESEPWNKEAWGMPISQEDLVATNQCFSLEFFKGMEILGLPLTDEQQNAWFHTWKAIGRIMGIQEDLLFQTKEEAWVLQKNIYEHLFNDIDHASGIALAKALVEALSVFLLTPRFTLLLMRKMLKDEQFPDLYYNVLGPSFGKEFPSLFRKTRGGPEDEAELEGQLDEIFHQELKDYTERLKEQRQLELSANPATRNADGEMDKKLIDYQFDVFDEAIKDLDPENPVNNRGLLDDVKNKVFQSVSAVIISGLSKYFRLGKNSGFRIPADLKEHWAL